MSDYLSIFFAAALVNNVVLVQLLGVSALFAYTRSFDSAVDLAWVGGIVMSATTALSLLLYHFLLQPLQLEILQLTSVVMISAGLTAALLRVAGNHFPVALRRQRLELYLLSGNSAIVGLALLQSSSLRSLTGNLIYGLGAALGFALVLVAFAALRLRLASANIPQPLRGAPIQLISAGITAMCLLGFAGVV